MKLLLRILVLVSVIMCGAAEARRMHVVVSTPPPMREVVPAPGGYADCYEVGPGFYHGVWANRYRVCEYNDNPYGEAWVSGYWRCDRYRGYDGVCLDWNWVPSHWTARRGFEFQAIPPHYFKKHNHHHHHRGVESRMEGPGQPGDGFGSEQVAYDDGFGHSSEQTVTTTSGGFGSSNTPPQPSRPAGNGWGTAS